MRKITGYSIDEDKKLVTLCTEELENGATFNTSFQLKENKEETWTSPEYVSLAKTMILDSRCMMSMIINNHFI